MTPGEASDIAQQIIDLNRKLQKAYPCPECKGMGVETGMDEWYGWHPCEPCFGCGWVIPSEDVWDVSISPTDLAAIYTAPSSLELPHLIAKLPEEG